MYGVAQKYPTVYNINNKFTRTFFVSFINNQNMYIRNITYNQKEYNISDLHTTQASNPSTIFAITMRIIEFGIVANSFLIQFFKTDIV